MRTARYRKLIVAVVGLVTWMAANAGLDIPPDQQANLVTIIMGVIAGGVYLVPNED